VDSCHTNRSDNTCRLCGGAVDEAFVLPVLGKYAVHYLRCRNCRSLQTERPYWIAEAYTKNLANLDTGAAQRVLTNLSAVYVTSRLLRLNDIVDFGGGDGLLCRLLRDYGVNCRVSDKYASAIYAPDFVVQSLSHAQILLAFEVLEHFENPRDDLHALFSLNAPVVLASTGIFSDQGADWWYLSPQTGQHVFFYSAAALRLIAATYGYSLLICSGYSLFLKPGVAGGAARQLLRGLLQRHLLRLVGAAMRLMPARGVWRDFEALRSCQPDARQSADGEG
jgi:Methyltransferase domain